MTQNFLKNAPLTGIGGNPLEPAASIGDYVRQFVLSPPFAWRWNRGVTTFNTVQGQQDYVKAISNFGWLEKASTNDNSGSAGSVVELQNLLNESEDASQSQPRYIGARLDDDQGNITFRLLPVPDKVYTVSISYQLAAPSFQNLSDTWAPIPDYLSYLYTDGFMARAYDYFDDPRFGYTYQKFLKELMATSEGLDSTQKNIYLEQFLSNNREQAGVGLRTQIGTQSRGGY